MEVVTLVRIISNSFLSWIFGLLITYFIMNEFLKSDNFIVLIATLIIVLVTLSGLMTIIELIHYSLKKYRRQ